MLLWILLSFASCTSKQYVISYKNDNKTIDSKLYSNDSVQKFKELQNSIINKSEALTSYNNIITKHFKKFISEEALKEVKFKEWRKNIFIEFTVNKTKQIVNYNTNTSSKKLDKQIKIAFKTFEFDLIQIQKFDPIYKYSIVIIQNINGKPTIKCNERAIGYIPPIFSACTNQKTYQNLNKCNYLYITDYLYNHVNLIYVYESDIDKNYQIYPQLIINKQGKVEAAKVESQNKELLESYYKAIKSIPPAKHPAKFNDVNEYYGYNFPTSIYNIIKNSNDFKNATTDNVLDHVNTQRLIKNYIHHLHEEGNVDCKYKVH